MKLRADQLKSQLAKGPAPAYLVGGDDALLVQEACDAIRAAARKAGCSERHVADVTAAFDWDQWLQSTQAQSLFAEQQLLELRLASGKPGDAGAKALAAYCAQPASGNVLLVVTGKLSSQVQQTRWVKALDKAGVVVPIWPIDAAQLPRWVSQRMTEKGLAPTPGAVRALVDRVEGNLLACVQEIEKLLLLHGPGPLDEDAVGRVVADSSRFDVFGLADRMLAGDGARVSRIMSRLRQEGVEPVLVLWALAREIRALAVMAYQVDQGQPVTRVMAQQRVWDKRKPLIQKALARTSGSGWQHLLQRCARVDRVVKGAQPGSSWDELLELALSASGTPGLGEGARSAG